MIPTCTQLILCPSLDMRLLFTFGLCITSYTPNPQAAAQTESVEHPRLAVAPSPIHRRDLPIVPLRNMCARSRTAALVVFAGVSPLSSGLRVNKMPAEWPAERAESPNLGPRKRAASQCIVLRPA